MISPEQILNRIPVADLEIWIVRPQPKPRAAESTQDKMTVITAQIATKAGVEMTALFAPTRGNRRVSDVRMVCYYAIRHFIPYVSFPEIAKFFNRDHSTIVYGVNVIGNRIAVNDPWVMPLIKDVLNNMKHDKV